MTINPNITPEPEQPDNAVHVADPLGIYVGFWLTPEQALMVSEMRVKKTLGWQQRSERKPRSI